MTEVGYDKSRRVVGMKGGTRKDRLRAALANIAITVMVLGLACLIAWLVGSSILPEDDYGIPDGCHYDSKTGTQCDR